LVCQSEEITLRLLGKLKFWAHCTIQDPIFRFPNACVAVVVFPFRYPFLLHVLLSAFSITHPQRLSFPVVRHYATVELPASSVVQWRPSFPCFASGKMVQHISQVITEYEERLRRRSYVPRSIQNFTILCRILC